MIGRYPSAVTLPLSNLPRKPFPAGYLLKFSFSSTLELSDIDEKIKQTKAAIKEEEKHILWSALPAEEKFKKRPSSRRTLINTFTHTSSLRRIVRIPRTESSPFVACFIRYVLFFFLVADLPC